MRGFSDYNPIAMTVYFGLTAGLSMFCMDPLILLLSLFGGLTLFCIKSSKIRLGTEMYFLLLFIVTALINPLISHNGVTVLFVLNDNPVTLEAFLYGIAAGVMIITTIYWFRTYSSIMTSDRLLYLFGALSPKLALVLSMALRYIPLLGTQAKKVEQTQRALGLYKENNVVDTARGKMRVLSVMVTWALENGIITADSMVSRGYGIGRRTHFKRFRFDTKDALLTLITVTLFGLALYGQTKCEFTYYPAVTATSTSVYSTVGYISYGTLVFIPTIIEIKEALKWKYSKSKI